MTQNQQDAIRKIVEDMTPVKSERLTFMRTYIADAICSFCEQDNSFATAVLAPDKSLSGCLLALCVEKERYISDFDVYSRAAKYFFPDAIVEWSLKIRPPKSQTPGKILELNFDDLLI